MKLGRGRIDYAHALRWNIFEDYDLIHLDTEAVLRNYWVYDLFLFMIQLSCKFSHVLLIYHFQLVFVQSKRVKVVCVHAETFFKTN